MQLEYAYMLIRQKLFSVLLYVIFVTTSKFTTTNATISAAYAATIIKPYRVATKLIHPHSILSTDRAKWATGSLAQDDILAGVITDDLHTGFLVNISIGEPIAPQLLVMDTGSDLLWVQCQPCVNCINQYHNPIFDPSRSSTYHSLPCDYAYCAALVCGRCDSLRDCEYFTKYLDNTNSTGTLSIEKLTFMTSSEGLKTVPNVVFGCGHNNHGVGGRFSGILGLGANDISLVTQMGSKFSYCLGNVSDPHYKYNHLILGEGAKIEGYLTPIQVHSGHYYLTLENISVGEKILNIEPKTFRRTPRGARGVVIDSGSTYTYLTKDGFESLSTEVQNLMDGLTKQTKFPSHPKYLCYEGIVSRDVKGFPAVTFHFAGGADLVLDTESMFRQVDKDHFCMSVRLSEEHGLRDLSIIGIMAQQYYNFGYDLAAMKLSFQRIDCELLDD